MDRLIERSVGIGLLMVLIATLMTSVVFVATVIERQHTPLEEPTCLSQRT